jgi:2-pyrone-4,6-dicarboxylate lactonase
LVATEENACCADRVLCFDLSCSNDRIIWGTDWPHPQWTKRMMNDAEEVELLYRYVDGEQALLWKILIDNPARLHGFQM